MEIKNRNGTYIEQEYSFYVTKGTSQQFYGTLTTESMSNYEPKSKTICYVNTSDGRSFKFDKSAVTSLAINNALRFIKIGQINAEIDAMIETSTFEFKCADDVTRSFSLKRENQQNATALKAILNPKTVSDGLIKFEVFGTNLMYQFQSMAEFTKWYDTGTAIVSAMYSAGKAHKKQLESVTENIMGFVYTLDKIAIKNAAVAALQSLTPYMKSFNVKVVTTNYAIADDIDFVIVKNAVTVLLPVPVYGRKLSIINHHANTGNVVIGGYSVDGAPVGAIDIQPLNKINLIAIDNEWLSI